MVVCVCGFIWPSRELCGIKPSYCETTTMEPKPRPLQWSNQTVEGMLVTGCGGRRQIVGKVEEGARSRFVWSLGKSRLQMCRRSRVRVGSGLTGTRRVKK